LFFQMPIEKGTKKYTCAHSNINENGRKT